MSDEELRKLKILHTPRAIEERLAEGFRHSYLKDFIYGAVDGAITTFAVVSGVAGAGLSMNIVIILGVANLAADGLSMAVSNFLGTRAEEQLREKAKRTEEEHIRKVPEGEREEVRQIFARKGFQGETLEKVVKVITSDPDRWVNVMLTEEFGYAPEHASPWKAALSTFAAFILVGSIPLAPFFYQWMTGTVFFDPFMTSVLMTGIAFFAVGAVKSRYVHQSWFVSGLETLAVGGAAASVAFAVGHFLRNTVL